MRTARFLIPGCGGVLALPDDLSEGDAPADRLRSYAPDPVEGDDPEAFQPWGLRGKDAPPDWRWWEHHHQRKNNSISNRKNNSISNGKNDSKIL